MQAPESQDYEEQQLDQPTVAWFLPEEDNDEDTKINVHGSAAPWSRSIQRRTVQVKDITLESIVRADSAWYWDELLDDGILVVTSDDPTIKVIAIPKGISSRQRDDVIELASTGSLYAVAALEDIDDEPLLDHLRSNGVIVYDTLRSAYECIQRDIFNL